MRKEKIKVIIADDDGEFLDIIVDGFPAGDYKIIRAKDGLEATLKFQNEEVDVVVTDIKMPKKDGIKFAKQIQENRDTPIIIMCTTDEADEFRTELEILDDVEILYKPFSADLLIEKIKKILEKKDPKKPAAAKNPVAANALLNFSAGAVIIEEGTTGDDIFYVKEGTLEVKKHLENGSEIHITDIETGEIVGELGFLSDGSRTASVYAKTDCVLMQISREKFDAVLEAQPKWFKVLFHTISKRLESTTKLLAQERNK